MQSQYQSQFHMGYPGCQRGQSFKDKLLNNFSKKNKRSHCHDDFGFQPFFDQLGKKIESKVEECKVKAMEKINCKTQDLKGYLMKKMTETFTNSNANRPVPEERSEANREEAKADLQAVSQVVHRYEEQQVGSNLDSTVTCQYCNDNIIVGFMEEHVSSCIYRRENNMTRCGDCGGYYKMTESQNHFRDCKGNIENINIQCEKCNDMVAMKSYFYHMSICGSQTFNNRDQQLPQIPAREISECAICLLEIKRDGSGRFLECAHHFHSDCINDWAKKQKACPICMHQFE